MKKQKETQILLVGLSLIVLVMIITVARNIFFPLKEKSSSQQTENKTAVIPEEKFKTINSISLKKKIDAGEKINLLDIRGFESYSNEHILDSINVPIDEFPAASKIIPENPVILITTDLSDEDKTKVETAIKSLKDEHIKNIQVLAGGIEDWKKTIGATINFGNPKSFIDQAKVSYVETDKLNEALKKNIPTFILDVRSSEEYSIGHIKGSINVPFNDLEKRRNELKAFPKIVVVGINELQEFQASVQLYDMILIQPFVLKGGIEEWRKKEFELVK